MCDIIIWNYKYFIKLLHSIIYLIGHKYFIKIEILNINLL
jgi:hypothetical protein